MKLRLQQQSSGRIDQLIRFRLCIQVPVNKDWTCYNIRQWQLVNYLATLAGVNDPRDISEIQQQSRAAKREWGDNGYVEFDEEHGTRRARGAL